MTVASGWKPAQAGTNRAPKAVPAIRSRRVIPDTLARWTYALGIGGEPAEIPHTAGESSGSPGNLSEKGESGPEPSFSKGSQLAESGPAAKSGADRRWPGVGGD